VVQALGEQRTGKLKMGKWFLFTSGVIGISTAIAVFIGQAHERLIADRLEETLIQSASRPVTGTVDFKSFSELPSPVARYFRHVLSDGQALIRTAVIRQSGVLRTSTTTERWSSFTANQLVVPPATGFVWNARVKMPLATHVRILDSYSAGMRVPLNGEVGWYVDGMLQIVWKGDLINARYELGP
jgi:hypothetical protein